MGNTSDRSHTNRDLTDNHADAQEGAERAGSEPDDESLALPARLGQARHVDQRWLHRMNCTFVLTCVREHGPITRVKIAEMTSLSRATVTLITAELLQEGVIQEGERLPSTARGGRRAVLLYACAHRGDVSAPDART